jgi:hypothetical protein
MSIKSVLGDVAYAVGAGCVAGITSGALDAYVNRTGQPSSWVPCRVLIGIGSTAIAIRGDRVGALICVGAHVINERVYSAVLPYFHRLFSAPIAPVAIPPAHPINDLFFDPDDEQEMSELSRGIS